MDQCLRQICASAVARDIHVAFDIPEETRWVRGDLRRMRQVLLNILTNAAKFTGEGGSVQVTARRTATGMTIHIADTGVGIPGSDIAGVLRPYRSSRSVKDHQHEGTGLGLPISKALMEMHDGQLTIDSTPGVGTTVCLTLPLERLMDPD